MNTANRKMLKLLGCTAGIHLCAISGAYAVTAQDIVDTVNGNLDNVSDFSADVDIDYDDTLLADMTDGTVDYKRSGFGAYKINVNFGSPYDGTIKSDAAGWNVEDNSGDLRYLEQADGEDWLRFDMFSVEEILDAETWTLAGGTFTVNSISCYKIYTSKASNNYTVWVDSATYTKIIRMETTDENDDLATSNDYNSYSNVESTAYLPSGMVQRFYDGGILELTSTVSLSNIDIQQGLANSVFTILKP